MHHWWGTMCTTINLFCLFTQPFATVSQQYSNSTPRLHLPMQLRATHVTNKRYALCTRRSMNLMMCTLLLSNKEGIRNVTMPTCLSVPTSLNVLISACTPTPKNNLSMTKVQVSKLFKIEIPQMQTLLFSLQTPFWPPQIEKTKDTLLIPASCFDPHGHR